MRIKIAGGLAVGLAATLVPSQAGADPKAGETFALVCDNGTTYQATSNGNGEFTPAHDLGGTGVFVPVSFGTFSGTIRNAQGQVVDSFTEPGTSKGQSAKGLSNPVTCTFSFSEVSDGSDPEFPAGFTFSGSGSATVRLAPGK